VAVPSALVFIATDDEANPNWLGSAAPDAIAEQIAHAAGPSGANCDYVYRLAAAMREVRAHLQMCMIGPATSFRVLESWLVCLQQPCGHSHGYARQNMALNTVLHPPCLVYISSANVLHRWPIQLCA